MARNNKIPQNPNRQIKHNNIHVQMEENKRENVDKIHVLQPTNK